MDAELERLMDIRHAAFWAAWDKGFDNEQLTRAWREANRNYVLARDAARRKAANEQKAQAA